MTSSDRNTLTFFDWQPFCSFRSTKITNSIKIVYCLTIFRLVSLIKKIIRPLRRIVVYILKITTIFNYSRLRTRPTFYTKTKFGKLNLSVWSVLQSHTHIHGRNLFRYPKSKRILSLALLAHPIMKLISMVSSLRTAVCDTS